MGRRFDEVKGELDRTPYRSVEAKNGAVGIKVGDETMAPPAVSAKFCKNSSGLQRNIWVRM